MQRFRNPRLAGLIIAPLIVLLLVACGAGAATPTPTSTNTPIPPTSTPAPPTPTPTPDPAVLLRDGGIAIVEEAYNRLLDEYIDPLDPGTLLRQAWQGATAEASAQGVGAPSAPLLAGDRTNDFSAFRAAYTTLVGGAPDATQIRYAALRTMASSLNDCHTFFLTPVTSDTILETRAGEGAVGIGVELAGVPPLITEVIAGGPADVAGVLVGDRIATIDGADAAGMGPAAALERINGHEGTSVHLRLRRPSAGQLLDLTIPRERVVPQYVEARVLDGGIGYVRIRNFIDGGVHDRLREVFDDFEREGVTAWVIDIRNNPGGRLDADAAGLFIPEGVVVRNRGRGGKLDEYTASGDVLPALHPAALLIDDRTGSVSEMFAAALQEYGVARLIGEPTNGCAGFTDLRPLADGTSLAVTTHVALGPVSGAMINPNGVQPDQWVARTQTDVANGRDPQLDAAIAYLAAQPATP